MPVPLDEHEPDVDLTPVTTKSDIVAFLYRNPEYGYRPAEIRAELDIPRGTATTTLKRLHDDGYVGKTTDSHYHALDRRDDLSRYVTSLEQLDRMFAERGEPDGTGATPTEVDEAELEAEVEALEASLDRDT
ncbi:MarR family transcriptional regulator [Salinarchaeum laminariae]|uniref:MarR family transcriptional regulator n=1 Tax=Salinarchaeum laminariae TaxID=869888 RepID=UPI0020C13F03|nr:helix-turn-helix domain-containing protein [Salinarchaeum laminariae]